MTTRQVILIAGPTASGKSALALALAARTGGVIVNADSMQVYRELPILTARPTADDERQVPHRLYGHVGLADAYSVGRYARDAALVLDDLRREGRPAIVVGGTGLYFKALTEGLSPVPPIPDDVRARWRQRAAEEGAQALHRLLAARDREMAARLAISDSQRIVRALEVLEATGRSLADWQRVPGQPIIEPSAARRLVVLPEREELYRRCDARFGAMMAQGAVEEARAVAALELDPKLPGMRALGLAQLMQLAVGSLGREQAIEAAQAETRQYVKRQITWLKRHMVAWKHVNLIDMQSISLTII